MRVIERALETHPCYSLSPTPCLEAHGHSFSRPSCTLRLRPVVPLGTAISKTSLSVLVTPAGQSEPGHSQ